ncbi:tetratricopeptide repeat protein [Saccharothrix sp. NRRL B-16348]|uniref:tetratricopeptide repeat protein n=1 Tax=Saccharothrix sp. NRRL B-16348 TaxID=1415542 RepID=UPI0012FA881A|nr:hypothetical protein [Saccharothrix sp. NRRL B-16348]
MIFVSVTTGSIAALKNLRTDWPSWVIPAASAALGVITAYIASWAQSEVKATIDHRRMRHQRQIGGEQALLRELGSSNKLPRLQSIPPNQLGVHAAVRAKIDTSDSNASDWNLPQYVTRDIDEEIRQVLSATAKKNGFLLLIGNSSAGKTRCAYEGAKAVAPQWQVFRPKDGKSLNDVVNSGVTLRKTIIWLDEIQQYLDGENAITSNTVQKILNASGPTIIIGTIWPDLYYNYLERESQSSIPPGRGREVLRLSITIDVSDSFTKQEIQRAREVSQKDDRIAEALQSSHFGLTQMLAAAPELIRRWESAPTAVGRAILTAAIDIWRLGVKGAVSDQFLKSATPLYLSPTERAQAAPNWYTDAIKFASKRVKGATSALLQLGNEMSVANGYTVADYLAQRGSEQRRSILPPMQLWEQLLNYTEDMDDLLRVAKSAQDRILLRTAEKFYLKAIGKGSAHARTELANMYNDQGRGKVAEDLLRAGIVNEAEARSSLAYMLQQKGRWAEEEEIRQEAVRQGDSYSKRQLAELFIRTKRVAEAEKLLVQALAEGDLTATAPLSRVLEGRGNHDEAETLLRTKTTDAADHSESALADFLCRHNRLDEAEEVLRQAITSGQPGLIRSKLVDILNEQSRHEEAEEILREAVAEKEPLADLWLAIHFTKYKREDEAEEVLKEAFERGSPFVGPLLAARLQRRGLHNEANDVWQQARAGGDPFAAILYGTIDKRNEDRIKKYGLEPDGSVCQPWW